MAFAQPGSMVTVQYIGTLDSGRIFDSTTEDEALTFTLGKNEVFPKLEEAIKGMRVGEVKNIVIASADAYGPRLESNVLRLHRSRFPAGKELQVGQKLTLEFGGSTQRVMIIIEVGDEEITLDGNHPLAGQDLTFALRLVKVE